MTEETSNLGLLFAHNLDRETPAAVDLRVPDHPWVVTFRELDERCNAVARALVARGLGPGDRLALLALNRIEYVEVLLGALRAGCVPIPINIKLPRETVHLILADAGARLAFAEPPWRDLVGADAPVVDLDADYEAWLDPGPFEALPVAPDQVSMQPYTAGTTGRPKGVLLTHRGQGWAMRVLTEHRRIGSREHILISAPFFHKNALVAIKTSLYPGACLVILPRFDARASLEAIERYGITMLTGVPTMLHLMLDEADRSAPRDLSTVRTVSMGSSPASDTLLARIARAFPGARIQLNYGITEGGPIMLGWFHPEDKPRPLDSVGYPMPGCEYRFEGGPHAREGELVVRNPGVALGYHNLPAITAERFGDGWFRTGDILRQDEEGWFYFVGRVDDMFVTGGENVYPGELEAVLERHPDIVQATVLPFPHEVKGMVPYAFVVVRPGCRPDEQAVKAYALAHAPAYMHPRRVFFVPRIPLTGTNKVDREALRRVAASDAGNAEE
ncbi:MAG: acyl--CoA ligase [Gammaproteobacteria bacterium]|nr:acyl--CoA ligase [Gammaproteobacteria bacterium]NIR84380.1 acyl--CoA ligase [Gammaproteobacteria bacterium]NIR90861.1 acyl--CoA ligase [Gammaproteobacteria bacterium]NIU07047.1 acyl--CoA ligase [Gammaproteobacteria bacterium]NIV76176.1 AMP-binding protein [Gammaproteobacteria bacterium]